MGMDVYGSKPKTQKGEYFRNNVWFWHPLWDYCETVSPEITSKVQDAHSNSGDGLDALDSRTLGFAIKKSIEDGTAEKYVSDYYDNISNLPKRVCTCCTPDVNTGLEQQLSSILSAMFSYDKYGDIPFPKTEQTPPNPDCKICNGSGELPNYASSYHITIENISSFSDFLIDCGGFQIW